MSKRVIGNVEVTGDLKINNKSAITSINGIYADPMSGDINLPIISKQKLQNVLSMLPVSRVGDLNNLPINANQLTQFSTGTTYSYGTYIQPVLLEANGSASIIRSTTDSKANNWYYSYIPNIRTIVSLKSTDINNTLTPFVPTFFTSDPAYKITQFYNSDTSEVLLYKIGSPSGTQYALSLTNGTFDTSLHQSVTFPISMLTSSTPMYAHIVRNSTPYPRVLIWCKPNFVTSMAINCFEIPVSDIINNTVSTATPVVNFNGQTLRGRDYTQLDMIQIYDSVSATIGTGTAATALFNTESGVIGSVSIIGSDMTYNLIAKEDASTDNVRLMWTPSYNYQTIVQHEPYEGVIGISMNIGMIGKSVVYDHPYGDAVVITGTNVQGNIIPNVVNPYPVTLRNVNAFYDNDTFKYGSFFQANDGFVLSVKSSSIADDLLYVQRAKVSNFVSGYDSLNVSTRHLNSQERLESYPFYLNPIGTNLAAPRMLDNKYFLCNASGAVNSVKSPRNSIVLSQLVGTETSYTYKTMQNTTGIPGYTPSPIRKVYPDTDLQYTGLISLIDVDNSIQTYGTSFIKGFKNTAQGKLDVSTMTFDSTYTMQDSVLQQMEQDAIAMAGITAVDIIFSAYYHIPDDTYSKCLGIVYVFDKTKMLDQRILLEGTSTLNGNDITSVTVLSTNMRTIQTRSPSFITEFAERMSGCSIQKFGTYNIICVDSLLCSHLVDDYYALSYMAKFSTSTNNIVSLRSDNLMYTTNNGSTNRQNSLLPGVGFGYYDYSPGTNDAQTKLNFNRAGTTEADLDAYIAASSPSANGKYVLIGQEMLTSGFLVQFTDTLPVFLGGIFYKIPPTIIDLSTVKADPSNTTFLVYIKMDQIAKTATYVIQEAVLPESYNVVYIGKIVTTTTIDTIDVQKVSRFLTYRPSTVNVGTAIPVSTGSPTQPSTRWQP